MEEQNWAATAEGAPLCSLSAPPTCRTRWQGYSQRAALPRHLGSSVHALREDLKQLTDSTRQVLKIPERHRAAYHPHTARSAAQRCSFSPSGHQIGGGKEEAGKKKSLQEGPEACSAPLAEFVAFLSGTSPSEESRAAERRV